MIPEAAVEAARASGWTRERLLGGVDYIVLSGAGSIWRRFALVRHGKDYVIEEAAK